MSIQNHEIQFHPSKQFLRLMIAFLFATELVILFLPCSLWIKLILTGLTFSYGYWILFRYVFLKSPYSITGLTLNEGNCLLHFKQNSYPAQLCGDSVITRFICILRFKIPGKWLGRSCVIFQDSFKDLAGYRGNVGWIRRFLP